MQTAGSHLFYSRLPVNEIPLSDLLTEEHLFYTMPPNWFIVITDVKNSTAAIQNGFHETINLVATASIVAVLNIVFRSNISIPFFFGGNASIIIPPSCLEEVLQALGSTAKTPKPDLTWIFGLAMYPWKRFTRKAIICGSVNSERSEQFVIPVLLGATD